MLVSSPDTAARMTASWCNPFAYRLATAISPLVAEALHYVIDIASRWLPTASNQTAHYFLRCRGQRVPDAKHWRLL
jgi:hypothetical protein